MTDRRMQMRTVGPVADDFGVSGAHPAPLWAAVDNKFGELNSLAEALARAMEAEMNGYQIGKDEQRELFGEAFSDEYAAEAEERWGDCDMWAQSQQRTKSYTKEQWRHVKTEMDEVNEAYAELLTSGVPASDVAAMDVAERIRLHISEWFYDCSPHFAHDAIVANSARQG